MLKHCLVLSLLVSLLHSAKFPSNWKKCPKKGGEEKEECLKKAIGEVLLDLKNGKKEVNVIPLDPLHFTRMEMNKGGNGPVAINLTFYEMDLIGASRFVMTKAKIDWDKYEIELGVDLLDGSAMLVGDYTISGKVLLLPINGKGKANITLDDFSGTLKLKGKELTKNNKKYFKAEVPDLTFSSSRVHLFLGNLFDGNPQLGDNMNKFLNDNWKEIMNELNGTISQALGLGVMEVANNFFMKVPVTELYD